MGFDPLKFDVLKTQFLSYLALVHFKEATITKFWIFLSTPWVTVTGTKTWKNMIFFSKQDSKNWWVRWGANVLYPLKNVPKILTFSV